ncbi:hypothetical protein Tco_0044990 [Tanacetum coccineum]
MKARLKPRRILKGHLGTKTQKETNHPLICNQSTILLLILQALVLSTSEEDILGAGEEMDEDPQTASIAETHHQYPSPQADKPQSSHAPSTEASDTDSSCDDTLKKYDNTLPLTERQLVKYLRKVSTALFGRIVGKMIKRDQTDKLVEASMSSLNKSNNTISDLYKGLNIITELLKEINNVVKDNPVITKISTNMTKVLSLVKGFNFSDLRSSVNAHQAHAFKQDEELAAWAKSSTNMAWNLGSRLSGLKRAQNHIQSNMSSLKEDTHSIKNMMTEMYKVFKGQSSGSVTPTLALTHILANVEGENDTNTATKDPPSHTEGETDANRQEKSEEPKHSTDANIELIGSSKLQPSITQAQPITTINPEPIIPQREGKGIATDEQVKDQRKLVKASSIIRPDPDALIPYTINGEDAEHEVLKRQHTKKVRKSIELRKHKFDNYMWTISSRLKLEIIADINIHQKTKPVVIIVFKGTDGGNFDVHKPFAFGAFGISELDELREIIPRKKNAVVQDLMNSLSRRYERIRKIPEELGIKSALPAPAPAPEQASSKSSRRKRKHMNLSLK